MIRNVYAEINLDALRHNFIEIRRKINPSSKWCAVVKANAYGHGAIEVSKVAVECGADFLAVATIAEGLQLRNAGLNLPILILGLIPTNTAEVIVANDLTPTIVDLGFAEKISIAAQEMNKIAKVHLKVDTGMGRIGIAPENVIDLAKKISKLHNLELEGIFSHLADADSPDRTFTRAQIKLFSKLAEKIRAENIGVKIFHIADSAAILDIPEAHFDMVRSGIVNYGLYPSPDFPRTINVIPVMKLIAKISFLKKISKGTSIGYNREFVAKRDSVIATLPIGHADGYIRGYKNFHVEVRGQLAPIVGRICMDQMMIDVTDIDGVQLDDEVILLGSDKISIDDAAIHLGTIDYEVVCLISDRVPRIFRSLTHN